MITVNWPDVFFRKIPDEAIGAGMILAATLLMFFAITSILAGLLKWSRDKHGWNLDLWLGVWFLVDAAGLHGVLGWVILTDDKQTDLWVAVWFMAMAISTLALFAAYGRNQTEEQRT